MSLYDILALQANKRSLANENEIADIINTTYIKGVATNGSSTSLQDSSKNFLGGSLVGKNVVFVINGTEYRREISDNTENEISFDETKSFIEAGVNLGTGLEGQGQVSVFCQGDLLGTVGNGYSIQVIAGAREDDTVDVNLANNILTVTIHKTTQGEIVPFMAENLVGYLEESSYLEEFYAVEVTAGEIPFMVEPLGFTDGEDIDIVAAGTKYIVYDNITSQVLWAIEELEGNVRSLESTINDIHGIPADGTEGQILAKASDDDYALAWIDAPSGGDSSTVARYGAVGDGETDDTEAIQNAIDIGGIITFTANSVYKVTSAINISSDTIVKGNNSTISIPSGLDYNTVFQIENQIDVKIENFKIISTADKARVIERDGLGSNVIGIHITTDNHIRSKGIIISNVYGENLEYLIKIDGEDLCFNRNITLEKIKSYNCAQPIYMKYVDGVVMREIDLDQATDVEKLDHHLYIDGNSYNVDIDNIIVRRGTSEDYSNAYDIASSSSDYLENIRITNAKVKDLNAHYIFALVNTKNMVIDGFQGELDEQVFVWYHDVDNLLITNCHITGTVERILQDALWDTAGYNHLVSLQNNLFNITAMGYPLMQILNTVVQNNNFIITATSASTFFTATLAIKMFFCNNIVEYLSYPNNEAIFRVNSNGSTDADILIDNNVIINSSGSNLNFIIEDYTDILGSTRFVFGNNKYRGYNAIYYDTKQLLCLSNNTNLDALLQLEAENLLTFGGCESLTNWNVGSPSSLALDSDNELEGTNCIKYNYQGQNPGYTTNLLSLFNTSKYYMFSGHTKNGNIASEGLRILMWLTGGTNKYGTYNISTNYVRDAILLQPSDFTDVTVIEIGIQGYGGGGAGIYAFFDGLMLSEISAADYARGKDYCLYKYPYNIPEDM